MALAMALAPLPSSNAIETKAEPPAAPDSDLTPQELIRAAERAYAAADWPNAERHLATLVQTYHTTPELAETVRRARALWVTARLRLKLFDATTVDLLAIVLADPKLDPAVADELAFWRGLCHLQAGAFPDARAALAAYVAGQHLGSNHVPRGSLPARSARRAEAVLLQAMCLLQEEQPAEAAAFLAPQAASLRQQKLLEAAGRASVLRLHALVSAGEDDAALSLVREIQPFLGEVTQMVAFHSLTLQLGSRLLENNRPHDAIACLQRVWSRDRILAHQQAAHERFTSKLQSLRRSPGQEALALQLESLVDRLQRESETFAKTESFDAALRFRIAAAYRDLGRAREAALVLEDLLSRLPADAVVEKAALSLIQCWMQIERWPQAVAAADAWLAKFRRPDNPDVPMVRFLRASALHADRLPHDAELAFAAVHQLHPDHDLAPRALFLEGICLLEQDLHREALDAFAETRERYPTDEVLEDAAYWSAMAHSFDKHHDEARNLLRAYLNDYKDGARHATEARFRIAFSTFGLAEYPDAVTQFRSFVADHADSPLAAEAHLLLGDALGALGQLDEAVGAYRRVDRATNARFHEEAVFRIGQIYKTSEQPEALRAHFGTFMADHPSSPRLAEAVFWIGQSHQLSGHPEAAREAYWQVLAAHGDDPAAAGIEDILTAMPKLYPGPAAEEELVPHWSSLAAKARTRQTTLALRLRWAKARLLAKQEPEQSRAELAALHPLLDPRRHHPRIIADCADALRESARTAEARQLYLDLRKWHPRAIEKDRAFLGLGLLALDDRKPAEALEFFARFERESIDSPLLGEVARLKAVIFEEQGRDAEAQAQYERLLELPTAPRPLKAETLLKLGDLMASQGQDLKSTAYYERVYVSYGKYLPQVAAAYARRAAALERLNKQDEAIEVWRTLANREDLAPFPESARAHDRMQTLDPEWRPRPHDPSDPSRQVPATNTSAADTSATSPPSP
jgi:TolA-binding protein